MKIEWEDDTGAILNVVVVVPASDVSIWIIYDS